MMLEDFFTLTEMRDGLSSLARVEELISMIQKLNDSSTSNLGDAARQWSTVASVLAATDHKECLNKFLELNGLSYLKKCLQEALDSYTDDNGIAVEELVITLLASFEKLPMHPERINASGVGATIELLMDHKSIKIKDKAKLLHDRLDHARKDDVNVHDQGKSGASLLYQSEPTENLQPSESGPNPSANILPCSMQAGEGKNEVESAETQLQISNVIGSLDSTNKEQVLTCNPILSTSLNPVNSNAALADVNSLALSKCQQDLSKYSTGTPSQFSPKEHADDQCDAIGSKDAPDQCDGIGSMDAPDSVKEIDMNIREVKPNDSVQKGNDNESSAFVCPPSKAPSLPSAKPMEHQSVDGVVDYGPDKCLITVEEYMPAADFTSRFQNHPCNASIPNNTSDPQLSTGEEAMSSVIVDLERELNFKSHKNHFSAASDFLKAVGTNANEEAAQRSGPSLECLDDALEVARQVAIAVEREVVDYREASCSSADVNSRETSGSHGPVSGEQLDEQMTEQVDRNSSVNEHSSSLSPEKGSEITQNISSDQENSDQDVVSPRPKVPTQESFANVIGDRCTFDLNANICSDEPECSMKHSPKLPNNVSAPVAVVASSKGTPDVPALRFGGEMGWKGSAATSAFRPASPRRTPDGERTSDPNQKSIFAAIDLNVAERDDEATDGPTLSKQLPASSSLPSGDSCVEVGSKTEVRNLDLNRHGDEVDASALPFSSWKLNLQNGERSLSSASSSSCRHSSFRDFDLNDNPSLADTGSHSASQPTTKTNESHAWKTADEPAIRIMGAEISLPRTDHTNKAQQFFIPNGMQMEPAMFTRPLLPCPSALTPAYGFGGLPTGPAMSVPPAYYSPGNFSYMSETRGMMTHIPQITGSVFSMSSARPFHYGATNMPYMTCYGGARPGFDLNNRMAPPESGRESGSLDHHPFFVQGHRGWMADPTEPSSSTISSKRKEPDSGWDRPPLNGHNWMSS